MTTFVRQSRTVAKAIDAGRKTGRANIEGSTPAEIQANLLRSLDEFTASIPTTKPQSHVKGSRGANHKKRISGVDLRSGFHLTSQALGYPPGKQAPLMADIAALIAKWRNDLEVEIYTENYEFQYGWIKSSRFNAAGEESEHYATYFHTRAKPNANDPLLIISFDSVAGQYDFMFIETITDHKMYFGPPGAGKTKAHVERRSFDLKRRIENGKRAKPQASSQSPEVDKDDDIPPNE